MDSINPARLAQGTGDSNLPGGTSLAQDDWEKHRKTITRLYCDEKLPLKKVRAILAQQHGFRATDRMFKARLKSWKLRKNCTTREMVKVIKIINDRASIGKDTIVRVRGIEVDTTKIRKFRQRKGLDGQDVNSTLSSGASTPSAISCSTPCHESSGDSGRDTLGSQHRHASASINAVHTPGLALYSASNDTPSVMDLSLDVGFFGDASFGTDPALWEAFTDAPLAAWTDTQTLLWDEMFVSMKTYFENYFQSSSWAPHSTQPVDYDGDEIQCPSAGENFGIIEANRAIIDFTHPGALVTLYEVACLLFQREETEEADRLIRQAADLIEALLIEEHPQLLSCLFLIVCIFEAKSRQDLIEDLLDLAYLKSAAIHGPQHPIAHMISCCSRAAAQSCPIASQALRGAIITFERLAGQVHTHTLRLKQIRAWSLFQCGQFEAALAELRELLETYELLAGDDHVSSRHALFTIGHVYAGQGKLGAAEAAFKDVYRRSEQKHGRDPPVMINLECLRMLAVIYRRQERLEEVVPTLCRALPVSIKLLGREHPTVLLIGHDLRSELK